MFFKSLNVIVGIIVIFIGVILYFVQIHTINTHKEMTFSVTLRNFIVCPKNTGHAARSIAIALARSKFQGMSMFSIVHGMQNVKYSLRLVSSLDEEGVYCRFTRETEVYTMDASREMIGILLTVPSVSFKMNFGSEFIYLVTIPSTTDVQINNPERFRVEVKRIYRDAKISDRR